MKKTVFSFLLLFSASAFAQLKQLSMEDAMLKARTALAPQSMKQLQFLNSAGDYVYLKNVDGKDTWMTAGFKTVESRFLSLEQLNEKLIAAGYGAQTSMPAIQFTGNSAGWVMNINGDKIALDPSGNRAKLLLPKKFAEKENAEESNAGYIAFVEDHNLFVQGPGGLINKVTVDGSKDLVYASSVHREEFGITKGTFWSNKGDQLAFYRMDQAVVTDYPIINWTKKPAEVDLIKYPMAGGKTHHVIIEVYNAVTRKTEWLATPEVIEKESPYLTNIAWSPDDKYIFIAMLNRGQNHMWLDQYEAATGKFVKTLFEETDAKYVEPLTPISFVKNNPGQFVWRSRRDGWNHLYLYDTSGRMIKQLTKGEWEVVETKNFDLKGDNLFYTSTQQSPVSKNLYQVNLKTGISKAVTNVASLHNILVSEDGSWVIDNYSSTSNPRTIQLVETKSLKTKLLLQAADPLDGYAKGELSIFTIKGKAGDDLYCRLFKPANFDPSKKYPVIVYWYGGSHAQLILNYWNGGASDYWFQYMAERGYVVFTVDTRGSENRGRAFEQSMFRKIGDVQMDDLMSGVDYLKSQPYVDASRMGLFGWSFGGFLTCDFMLNHAGVFKSAVAGGPVTNWGYYEIMYTERYMDTPQENPDGYAATDLTKQVQKLKGNLLLIHGLQDNVVVQQHSVNFVKACVDKGVQVDYMIYPGHEHNVLGKDRAHLYQKVTDYFMQHL